MASEPYVCLCDSGGLHGEHDHYANVRLHLFIRIFKTNYNIKLFYY